MINCERTCCFLGDNSLILSVLWSYFAFWRELSRVGELSLAEDQGNLSSQLGLL